MNNGDKELASFIWLIALMVGAVGGGAAGYWLCAHFGVVDWVVYLIAVVAGVVVLSSPIALVLTLIGVISIYAFALVVGWWNRPNPSSFV